MSGEGIFVEDIMVKDVITIETSTPIKEAAKKMDETNVGSIIVTKDEDPIGIITERDFVRRYAVMGISLENGVEDIMTLPLITISPDETIWEASELMKIQNVHKLPVMKDKKLVGIITNSDLIKLCSQSSDSEMRRICDAIITRMND